MSYDSLRHPGSPYSQTSPTSPTSPTLTTSSTLPALLYSNNEIGSINRRERRTSAKDYADQCLTNKNLPTSTLDRIDKRYSENERLLAASPQVPPIPNDQYGTAKGSLYSNSNRARPNNLVLNKTVSLDNEAEYASLRRKKYASASQVPPTPNVVATPQIPYIQSE